MPVPHEVVERRAHREPGDSEIRAQLALGRDRVADAELLDQVEHAAARLALLRHGSGRGRGHGRAEPDSVRRRGQYQSCGDGCRSELVPAASRQRRTVDGSKKWNRDGSTASSASPAPTRAPRPRIDARGEQRARVREERRVLLAVAATSVETRRSTRKKRACRRRAPRAPRPRTREPREVGRASAGVLEASGRTPRITAADVGAGAVGSVERDADAAEDDARRPRPSPRRGSSPGSR